MRTKIALILIAGLAISACSINDDLREFRDSVPERIDARGWPALVPLGNFAALTAAAPAPDAQSMAARAAGLRRKAAELRQTTVLDPARARAMRAALRRFAP